MKRLILISTLLLAVMSVMAQNSITVKFTAQNHDGQYQSFDRVVVKNITRGWERTLTYPDTTLVLNYSYGVGETNANSGLISNYPNPFHGTTETVLTLDEASQASIQVFGIDGKLITETTAYLAQGQHNIKVSLADARMAVLNVRTAKQSYALKMMSLGGETNDISVSTVAKMETREPEFGKNSRAVGGDFSLGDVMSYRAVSSTDHVYSYTVTQSQSAGETVTLEFAYKGAVNGYFSVSPNEQVLFSQGNLQYRASTDTWRFAEKQWHYVGGTMPSGDYVGNVEGSDNAQISPTYNGWIDLFGWGTGNTPTISSMQNADYPSFNDWADNTITNSASGVEWRTMSDNEWHYLLYDRVTASGVRYALAKVNEVCGMIVLPDDWNTSYYTLSSGSSFSSNVISLNDWETELEPYGAVFLPVTGSREGTTVAGVEIYLTYWSSTPAGTDNAVYMSYVSGYISIADFGRYAGRAVRPVTTIATGENPGEGVQPTATTGEVTNIYQTSASCTGMASGNGLVLIAKGLCWSTSANPTLNDSYTTEGGGSTSYSIFTSVMTGLEPYTTYHVRAYATNANGTAYGEDKTFTTLAPTGAIAATFSVSAIKQVFFSKGNLQYNAASNIWRFAENQWDFVGSTVVEYSDDYSIVGTVTGSSNHLISPTYNGWIDLFGWGTGGNPTNTSVSSSSYSSFNDWGNNPINNGGNTANQWRTLTKDEWRYLLFNRETSSGLRYVKAKVNNVRGLIILPDDWYITSFPLNNPNVSSCSYSDNIITLSEWNNVFETHGAVFMPAAGHRNGTLIYSVGTDGDYWSSSPITDTDRAYDVSFSDDGFDYNNIIPRINGLSVRLVTPAN